MAPYWFRDSATTRSSHVYHADECGAPSAAHFPASTALIFFFKSALMALTDRIPSTMVNP